MLKFCDFIQVFVFTTNHHLKQKLTSCRAHIKRMGLIMKCGSFYMCKKDSVYSVYRGCQ